MTTAYLNRIGTAVPPHDVHRKFVAYAPRLLENPRARELFERMAEMSGIAHRYSFLEPSPDPALADAGGFYVPGRFPGTAARMQFFENHALRLAQEAVAALALGPRPAVTHLIVACCTGFYAPGLDLQLVELLGLDRGIERTMVGFMGCQAAMNALKLARHIVRSEARARVLVVNLELCTLHLQETTRLEELLSFLVFADGCAASLVSAAPEGVALEHFATALLPDSRDQISWRIGGAAFDMHLSGRIPRTISRDLPASIRHLAGGRPRDELAAWAIHPGGRSVLDAVERSLELPETALAASRRVLHDFGNMSSPTVLFVLKDLMEAMPRREAGCAVAFGPGLTAESLVFRATA